MSSSTSAAGYPMADFLEGLNDLLAPRELHAPAQRAVVHSGYRPQGMRTSGGYYTAFETTQAEVFRPAKDAKARRVAFIADRFTALPPIALALAEAGEGYLVAQGGLGPRAAGASQTFLSLGKSARLLLRTTEAVHEGRLVTPRADAEVPADADRGPGGPAFQGKVVVLIDERAISQAEHTGLFLEATCGPTFVGSPTAGANGDVTLCALPGGVSVLFSGHDVRHADGRQLQRVGLVPTIEVRPTIQGLRAGKDEVLERALRFIKEGK